MIKELGRWKKKTSWRSQGNRSNAWEQRAHNGTRELNQNWKGELPRWCIVVQKAVSPRQTRLSSWGGRTRVTWWPSDDTWNTSLFVFLDLATPSNSLFPSLSLPSFTWVGGCMGKTVWAWVSLSLLACMCEKERECVWERKRRREREREEERWVCVCVCARAHECICASVAAVYIKLNLQSSAFTVFTFRVYIICRFDINNKIEFIWEMRWGVGVRRLAACCRKLRTTHVDQTKCKEKKFKNWHFC